MINGMVFTEEVFEDFHEFLHGILLALQSLTHNIDEFVHLFRTIEADVLADDLEFLTHYVVV